MEVVLPCALGETAYIVCGAVRAVKICAYEINESGVFAKSHFGTVVGAYEAFEVSHLYLTREAAEKALSQKKIKKQEGR